MKRALKISCILLILSAFSFSKKIETVFVFPGFGISLNNDTFVLHKTMVHDLIWALFIDDIPEPHLRHWDGYDAETLEDAHGWYRVQVLKYKNIEFEFQGKTDDSLILSIIKITNSKDVTVKVNDSILLGQVNPPLSRYFYRTCKYDFITADSLRYDFNCRGIGFILDSINNSRQLVEISIN